MNLNKDLLALRDQFFSPFESEFDKVFDQLMSGFGKSNIAKKYISKSRYSRRKWMSDC